MRVTRANTPRTDTEVRLSQRRRKVAAMPYLAARPLLHGLEHGGGVDMVHCSPSQMRGRLASGQADVALMPTIELQRYGGALTIVPAGCIASAGPSFTCRLYSHVRPEKIGTIWADVESSSSIALAQVLWASNYYRHLRIVPYDHSRGEPPPDALAVLVAGDKVITDAPMGFDWQFDLSNMWYQMTALPFVWSVWAAPAGADCAGLYDMLTEARLAGQQQLHHIATELAPAYGWPEDLALRYLTEHCQFEFTHAHEDGMEEFFDRAAACGIIEANKRLDVYRAPQAGQLPAPAAAKQLPHLQGPTAPG